MSAAVVMRTVLSLPTPLRDAVVAVDVAGLTHAESAAVLGIEPAVLARRLFEARAAVAAAHAEPLIPA